MGWFSKKKPSASDSPEEGDESIVEVPTEKKVTSEKEDALIASTSGKAEQLLAATEKETAPLQPQSRITFETAEAMDSIDVPAVQQGRYTIAINNRGAQIIVFDEKGQKDTFFTDRQAATDVYITSSKSGNCRGPAFVRGKYVIFLNPEKGLWAAWNTASDDGVILPPRNWKKITSDERALPSDLSKYADELLDKHDPNNIANKKLGTNYRVSVNANLIQVTTENGDEIWHDNVPKIDKNFCVDPTNANILYYCQKENPREMHRVDISSGKPPWHPVLIPFPQSPRYIQNLQVHPTGAFFVCTMGDSARHILRCDTLEEVPCPELNASQNVFMDEDGHFFCKKDNKVIRLETNLNDLARSFMSQRRSQALQGLSAQTILQKVKAPTTASKPAEITQDMSAFKAQKNQFGAEFGQLISAVQSSPELQPIRTALDELRRELRARGLQPAEVAFVTDDIESAITTRNQQLADQHVNTILATVRRDLAAGSLSLGLITDLQTKLKIDQSLEQLLSPALVGQISDVRADVARKADDLFLQQGGEVIQQITGMVTSEQRKLAAMTTQREFDEWHDRELPKQRRWLSELAASCPSQCIDALDRITSARAELQRLCDEYDQKFRTERDQIRERASKHTEQTVQYLEQQCEGLVERLRDRHFISRPDAEAFLRDNSARQELEAEIRMLAQRDADASRNLLQTLQVRIANFLYEVDRSSQAKEGADGRTMVPFGKTLFPRFEGHVREHGERRTELTFDIEERSKGPRVAPDELMGDVAMRVTTGDGHKLSMRLWEKKPPVYVDSAEGEDDFRYGSHTYLGQDIAPSYRSQKDFRALRALYKQWRNNGPLKQENDRLRKALHDHYALRERGTGKDSQVQRSGADTKWREDHLRMLQEFGEFCSKNQIPLLRRIDSIETADDPEFENGRGFVPEWQNHWVIAPEDETVLEQMANHFKMQLDNQEGILNLKGHAGTGKDVLLKIFASRDRANRPYFAFDCSKWTTEFELSEDIVLESKGGATQTVRVPSVVLNGIQTPGAIMYFNEFNAMPEQAQIFLHALFDEKRSLALKTSSGQTVKADPSVLFACSMNPGYPGTFDPQMATRSRMVELEIPYPPLHRAKAANDTLSGEPYSASEALKIARGVGSLRESTLDPDMNRNVFVKWWDGYVNKVGSQPKLNQTQRFDLDVVLALVQFGNKLRENFIKRFEKSRDANKALPVSQPVTLREMRRCAYVLSQMSDEEKANSNPERVARILLEQFFISHIDSADDRAKIKQAMDQWTSQKRAA